jgi:hypothetical protein
MTEARRVLEQTAGRLGMDSLVEKAQRFANPQLELMDEEDATPLRA